jgi:hypothetical protein
MRIVSMAAPAHRNMGTAATAAIVDIEPSWLLLNAFNFRRIEIAKASIELRITASPEVMNLDSGDNYSMRMKDKFRGWVAF